MVLKGKDNGDKLTYIIIDEITPPVDYDYLWLAMLFELCIPNQGLIKFPKDCKPTNEIICLQNFWNQHKLLSNVLPVITKKRERVRT